MRPKLGRGLLVWATVLLIILAGCGSAPKSEPATGSTAKATEAKPAAAVQEPAKPAEKFPEKPITIIDPWGAGGVTDLLTRALIVPAEKKLGTSIILKNVPGANATLGPSEVLRSKADGYTVGSVTLGGLAMAPHTSDLPYKAEDFDYIVRFGTFQYALAVLSKSPIKTIDDLVALAKKQTVTYSSAGLPGAIAMTQLGEKTGATFKYIPFQSGPEQAIALLAGTTTAGLMTPSAVAPLQKSGEARLLAIVSGRPWASAPGVKLLKDMGYGISVDSDLGLAVPKGTPPERIQKLLDAFLAAMKDPEYQQVAEKLGMAADPMTTQEFRQYVLDKRAEFEKPIRMLGLAKK